MRRWDSDTRREREREREKHGMDIQSLRDQAKEARQKAELQFLTMAAHGDSLKKQQELQKDLLPKKSSYNVGLGDKSPGGRGLEMRRLQAEQMEQRVKDMKRQLASRTWYDGSTLRPEEESLFSGMADDKPKADPLDEIFKFAKHAPPPPKETIVEAAQAKQRASDAAAAPAPPAPSITRPLPVSELSTFEIPTTSKTTTLEPPEEPSMKLFSKPPPSFQKDPPPFPAADAESDGGFESWLERANASTPLGGAGYPEMYPPPPPPLFQSSRRQGAEGEGGAGAPKSSKHKSGRRSKHKSSRRSRKEAKEQAKAEEAEQAKATGAVEEGSSDKENKSSKPKDGLDGVSEHSKRVASVHELEKERDALRQDIALLAAAVQQNQAQGPPPPQAPVIVQTYPMPQQQPSVPPAVAPAAQEPRPEAKEIAAGFVESRRTESSNEDLMRMFNSAFNSGDLELKKYLQHEVLRLRKRNDFLESERVDLLTTKAEHKRVSAEHIAVKAELETLRSDAARMREENARLQGLNDILTEEVKRGSDGRDDTTSLEAELASLRLMNNKLKSANKDLLEEQRNKGSAEQQLLERISELEAAKSSTPVRRLESQVASLQNENLEKEEELNELQERAAQIDRLREENAALELQLVEHRMRFVQEIPLEGKLKDAADEVDRVRSENALLAEQAKSLAALNDELKSTRKVLESKCSMYEKVLQEANLLTAGITMFDPTGNLAEKNKKEMASAVKGYIAQEYGLPQFQASGGEAAAASGSSPDKAQGTPQRSPSQSPHGKLIMQTGKENIQSYLVKASTRRDFMRMAKNGAVKALLARANDLEIEFSDLVFKRDAAGTLKKFILVVTKKSVYLLTSDTYGCEWTCAFGDLFHMGWDSQVVEDLTFKASKSVDLCIQSPRRDIVIGTILTLLENSEGSFQVKKDFSSFNLLRAV